MDRLRRHGFGLAVWGLLIAVDVLSVLAATRGTPWESWGALAALNATTYAWRRESHRADDLRGRVDALQMINKRQFARLAACRHTRPPGDSGQPGS